PALVWLILVLGGVAGSVRLGQASLRPTGRVVLAAASVLLLVFAVAALNLSGQRFEPAASTVDPYDGVVDVYPYDADGHPLSGVRLYDQDGSPIMIGDPFRCPQSVPKPHAFGRSELYRYKIGPAFDRGYPLCPPTGWAPSTGPQRSPSPAPSPEPSPQPRPSPSR
ncbi:MAG: hypothetical protein ACM30G_17800, partial [Micromonosporaceae bacterium]